MNTHHPDNAKIPFFAAGNTPDLPGLSDSRPTIHDSRKVFDPSTDVKASFEKSVRFGGLMLLDMVLFVVIVEVVWHWKKPFEGLVILASITPIRYGFYVLAMLNFFLVRWVANLPLKEGDTTDISTAIRQLQISVLLTYGTCEVPGALGLVLFFLVGARADFYVFLLITLFTFAVFRPRYGEWEEWVRKTVL